ncbi:MAG: response regulator transcription factor [Deltaproteobacteria bacterium]|nr:response regulator transcription factor [Deltaproteobacteria bacterium]
MKNHILIIEDEKDINDLLVYHLNKENFEVTQALNAEEGLKKITQKLPDLVILDLMLPQMSGLELCEELKTQENTKNMAVVMLTAKSETADIVYGLELGADDYITKPFDIREVVARLKAVLRRAFHKRKSEESFSYKGLKADWARHKIFVDKEEVHLTLTEFKILKALVENHGRVLTRDKLLDMVVGHDTAVIDRTIDVHILALRKKLKNWGQFIETIRGIGYRLQDE